MLGRRCFFVLSNGLHIVDPSGHSFWKKLFHIWVAGVVGLVTAAVATFEGSPILGFAAGAEAAASTYKALGGGSSSSVAEAAPSSPGVPATARQAISPPEGPGVLIHPLPDPSPVLLGDPIAEPGRTLLGTPIAEPGNPILDHPIDSPRPGILDHPYVDGFPSLYNALDVSDSPEPKEEQQDPNPGSSNEPENKPRQTGIKIPGSDVIHTDHPHGPYKEGHRHWLEWHTNPYDPSKRRKVKRTGPL